jgi:hypothetical protein
MNVEVIILAQGTQQRLGSQHGLKQLLPLPACGGMPILGRTLRQVQRLLHPAAVTVVATDALFLELGQRAHEYMTLVRGVELAYPGNSSLKGISRYLEAFSESRESRSDHTIVLLGDVVYSWACLEALIEMAADWGFVGSPDLCASAGELWGVAWNLAQEGVMLVSLRDALLRHPPFEDEYQPGQMRRWISGWRRGAIEDHVEKLRRTGHYTDIADYTHDIDLPADVTLLPWLSEAAAADDAKYGITWGAGS